MYLDHGKTWRVGANIPGIFYGQEKSFGDFCPGESQVMFCSPYLVYVSVERYGSFSYRLLN